MAFHPTGSDPYKWWPAASFWRWGIFCTSAMARRCSSSAAPGPGACRGPGRPPARPHPGHRGALSPPHDGRPAKHCRLLVANDSGPLHMGLALGVPTIALMGADDPRRVGPYAVEWGAWLHKREQVCDLDPCLPESLSGQPVPEGHPSPGSHKPHQKLVGTTLSEGSEADFVGGVGRGLKTPGPLPQTFSPPIPRKPH